MGRAPLTGESWRARLRAAAKGPDRLVLFVGTLVALLLVLVLPALQGTVGAIFIPVAGYGTGVLWAFLVSHPRDRLMALEEKVRRIESTRPTLSLAVENRGRKFLLRVVNEGNVEASTLQVHSRVEDASDGWRVKGLTGASRGGDPLHLRGEGEDRCEWSLIPGAEVLVVVAEDMHKSDLGSGHIRIRGKRGKTPNEVWTSASWVKGADPDVQPWIQLRLEVVAHPRPLGDTSTRVRVSREAGIERLPLNGDKNGAHTGR